MTKKKETPPKGAKNTTQNAGATGTEKKATTATTALEKIGRDTLESNPELSAVYVTSDGTPFGTNSDAVNHGGTLTDKNIVTVEREKAE